MNDENKYSANLIKQVHQTNINNDLTFGSLHASHLNASQLAPTNIFKEPYKFKS